MKRALEEPDNVHAKQRKFNEKDEKHTQGTSMLYVEEVIHTIMSYTKTKSDILNCMLVCSDWYEAILSKRMEIVVSAKSDEEFNNRFKSTKNHNWSSELKLDRISSIYIRETMEKLKNTRRIIVCNSILNLKHIPNPETIEELVIYRCLVDGFEALKNFKKLKLLDINLSNDTSNKYFKDLECLESDSLEILRITKTICKSYKFLKRRAFRNLNELVIASDMNTAVLTHDIHELNDLRRMQLNGEENISLIDANIMPKGLDYVEILFHENRYTPDAKKIISRYTQNTNTRVKVAHYRK